MRRERSTTDEFIASLAACALIAFFLLTAWLIYERLGLGWPAWAAVLFIVGVGCALTLAVGFLFAALFVYGGLPPSLGGGDDEFK